MKFLKLLTTLFLIIASCKTQYGQNKNINRINLSKKEISKFPKKHLKKRENITIINLSENRFTEFPIEILSFEKLEVLDLSLNKISSLPNKINKFEKLKTLNIRGTNITKLPNSINDLKNLKLILIIDVELTENEIEEMKCKLPDDCELLYSKNFRDYPPYNCI